MTEHSRPPMATTTLDRIRELRRDSTDAERKLWRSLRGKQIDGVKFRRQHPIPPYMVDFFCPAARLVIEVDGSQHSEEMDRSRTQFLEAKGLAVLRFWDNEVLTQTEAVLSAIMDA